VIEIENSLRRLGTDRIDLYQTHWPAVPPDATPIADTMAALLKLKEQGKVRALGVCNVSPAELDENLRHGGIVSDQFRYSMLHRAPEQDILPDCARKGLATLTYMSLEQGLLTGKVGMDRVFNPGEFRTDAAWNPWFLLSNRQRVLDLLAGWKALTDRYACTLAQLVIAWTAAQAGGGFEPAPYGTSWLEQPHHRGAWYYACETDLGYCAALRSALTVLADDPIFGRFCCGWRPTTSRA